MSDKIVRITVEKVKPEMIIKIYQSQFSELYEYCGVDYDGKTKTCTYLLIKKSDV